MIEICLRFSVNFCRVHYPLPLKFEADPNPAHLKSTISRLRAELDQLRVLASHAPSLSQKLTHAMDGGLSHRAADSALSGGVESSDVAAESWKLEQMRLEEENGQLKRLLHGGSVANNTSNLGMRGESAVLVRQLGDEVKILRQELMSKDREIGSLPNQTSLTNRSGDNERCQQLERQVWELEVALTEERNLSMRVVAETKEELERLEGTMLQLKESERKYRTQCRELSVEVDLWRKRARSRATAPHPTSSHRAPSPASRSSLAVRNSQSLLSHTSASAARSSASGLRTSPHRPSSASSFSGPPSSRGNSLPAGPRASSASRRLSSPRRPQSNSRPNSRPISRSNSRDPSPSRTFDPSAWVRAKEQRQSLERAIRKANAVNAMGGSARSTSSSTRGSTPRSHRDTLERSSRSSHHSTPLRSSPSHRTAPQTTRGRSRDSSSFSKQPRAAQSDSMAPGDTFRSRSGDATVALQRDVPSRRATGELFAGASFSMPQEQRQSLRENDAMLLRYPSHCVTFPLRA